MFNARTRNTFGRKNIAVFAALAISSLAATPFVMSASRALATSEDQPVAATLRVEPVEVAPWRPLRRPSRPAGTRCGSSTADTASRRTAAPPTDGLSTAAAAPTSPIRGPARSRRDA